MRGGVLLAFFAVASAASASGPNDPPADKVSVGFKLILEEAGGGTDSAVSFDGKFLAYSSRQSGNLDIWTVNIETGEKRQITTNPETDNEARWHPDGTHLTFCTQRNGSQDVYMVDLRTLEETPIAVEDFNEDYPSFSKDGKEICFTGGPRGFREVQVYNMETKKIRTVTRGYGYVGSTNFSLDGKQIVFHAYYDNSYGSEKSDVHIIDSMGATPAKNITNTRDVWDYKPNWSWDSKWITWSSRRSTPNFNIYIMRTDGSDVRAITSVEGRDLRWSNWTKDGRVGWHQVNPMEGRVRSVDVASGAIQDLHVSDFYINDLSLSADGSRLIYETDARVMSVAADGKAEPKALADGVAPRWANGGDGVTFLRGGRDLREYNGVGVATSVKTTRAGEVGLVSLVGNDAKMLGVTASSWPEAETPSWSPDGKSMVVVTDSNGKNAVTLVGADGAKKTLLETGDALGAPIFSADGKRVFIAQNRRSSVGYYITTEPVVKMEPGGN
jgi:TolB protein